MEHRVQRFYALEKIFKKNSDLQAQYVKCVQGYLDGGHMSLLNNQDACQPDYFHPHHAVIKIGPTIQDDLFLIVTRFRSHPIVLTADI